MSMEMQGYKCHKLVHAEPMSAKDYWASKGQEVPEGIISTQGYHVVYSKGTASEYHSWSPKKSFDEGYLKTSDGMSFGDAIEVMRLGKKVARSGWNGKGIFIELQVPDDHSKMTSPYIFIDTTGLVTDNAGAPKSRVPWLASQTDMLSNDWCVVDV